MSQVSYRGRRAVQIENDRLRVTVLVEGGHIAEISHKGSGVNPLWTPPWPSIEPSTYDRAKHPEYGANSESKLLAGLMGHNLCLDLFGTPSEDEAAAGLTVHGDASVVPYEIHESGQTLIAKAKLPHAHLTVEREIRLDVDEVQFTETVENLLPLDRPVAWTQHVTLGPPFVERGVTQFRAPAAKSMTIAGEAFDWPKLHGEDLRTYTDKPVSGGFSTHLMDPHRAKAHFVSYSPKSKLLFGYVWSRADFPWLGMWDENHSRATPPWNGKTVTRGMEFGASPIPESRRKMIDRGSLFGVPGFRWLPARGKAKVEYLAFARTADAIVEDLP